MSRAREIVDALMDLLAEERGAIRRLDVKSIARASARKESLAKELARLDADALGTVSEDIPILRAELRRNGILLVHARACIANALELISPREGGARRGTLRTRV